MTGILSWRRYDAPSGVEYCLEMGPRGGRVILLVPPLFDEMNRLRSTLVATMRELAARGIGSLLPDLPGCNESLAPLDMQDLASWRGAVNAAAVQCGATHIAALRGGALVDDGASGLPHWRLNPVKGATLLKTMLRTRIMADRERGQTTTEADLIAIAQTEPVELAGSRLGPAMVAALSGAAPCAVNRLEQRMLGEQFGGTPLWLRAEPQHDEEMAGNIAVDLDEWSAT